MKKAVSFEKRNMKIIF